jgi:hypothetical protein
MRRSSTKAAVSMIWIASLWRDRPSMMLPPVPPVVAVLFAARAKNPSFSAEKL